MNDDRHITYIAAPVTGSQPYHLRRLDYLNHLRWDEEFCYLNVMVDGVEQEFDFYSGGSIIHLLNQPSIGAKVELIVEDITFLD